MNLVSYLKKENEKGRGLHAGLPSLNRAIYGVQEETLYTVAGPSKTGKTMLTDYAFWISTYEDARRRGKEVKYEYFSYEISKLRKETNLMSYHLHKRGVSTFEYKNNLYEVDDKYLTGKLLDQDGEQIKVLDEHKPIIKEIFNDDIYPFTYSGVCDITEQRMTPQQMRNKIIKTASQYGNVKVDKDGNLISYSKSKDVHIIIIVDHIRKILGTSDKNKIDEWNSICVELRNILGVTIVNIVHINRTFTDLVRLGAQAMERFFPDETHLKDSGNPGEDTNVLITMFNPLHFSLPIAQHFGVNFNDPALKGRYRSIHLASARELEAPVHMRTVINPKAKTFTPLVF